MIIYKKSFPGGAYHFDGPDDALYARSESGWIDSELFLVWLRRLFLKHVVQQRPVLLITDGHKSHMTLDVIDTCHDNNVVLFCLPPHTTHALQPLDVSVFKSLKDTFSKAARAMSFAKKIFIISKREFSRVLKSPLDNSFSIPNIKAGFRKCGSYPFNPDAIAAAKMVPSQLHNSNSDAGISLMQLDSSSESSIMSEVPGSGLSAVTASSPVSSVSGAAVVPDSVNVSTSTTTVPSVTCLGSSPLQTDVRRFSGSLSQSGHEEPEELVLPSPSSSTSFVLSPSNPSPSFSSPSSTSLVLTPSASHLPPSFSPPSSSTSVQLTPSMSRASPVLNPLVDAGLISQDLADILATPSKDAAAVAKQGLKRITGARELLLMIILKCSRNVKVRKKTRRRKEKEE